MMDTEKRDADLEEIRKRIGGLKFRYTLLTRFRVFGSRACESKLYETKCEATKEFFSLNVAGLLARERKNKCSNGSQWKV